MNQTNCGEESSIFYKKEEILTVINNTITDEGEEKEEPFLIVKRKKKFLCPYENCKKFFQEKGNYVCHLRIHTGEKPYKCCYKNCQKRFSTQGNLKNHLNIHYKNYPYKCNYENCEKSYHSNSRLQIHIRTHLGIKPFKCIFKGCDKSFNEKGNMKTHVRTHTGEKPYKCNIQSCTKAFKTLGHLKDHTKTHFSTSQEKCQICTKSFSSRHLKLHYRNIHKIEYRRMANDSNEDNSNYNVDYKKNNELNKIQKKWKSFGNKKIIENIKKLKEKKCQKKRQIKENQKNLNYQDESFIKKKSSNNNNIESKEENQLLRENFIYNLIEFLKEDKNGNKKKLLEERIGETKENIYTLDIEKNNSTFSDNKIKLIRSSEKKYNMKKFEDCKKIEEENKIFLCPNLPSNLGIGDNSNNFKTNDLKNKNFIKNGSDNISLKMIYQNTIREFLEEVFGFTKKIKFPIAKRQIFKVLEIYIKEKFKGNKYKIFLDEKDFRNLSMNFFLNINQLLNNFESKKNIIKSEMLSDSAIEVFMDFSSFKNFLFCYINELDNELLKEEGVIKNLFLDEETLKKNENFSKEISDKIIQNNSSSLFIDSEKKIKEGQDKVLTKEIIINLKKIDISKKNKRKYLNSYPKRDIKVLDNFNIPIKSHSYIISDKNDQLFDDFSNFFSIDDELNNENDLFFENNNEIIYKPNINFDIDINNIFEKLSHADKNENVDDAIKGTYLDIEDEYLLKNFLI